MDSKSGPIGVLLHNNPVPEESLHQCIESGSTICEYMYPELANAQLKVGFAVLVVGISVLYVRGFWNEE